MGDFVALEQSIGYRFVDRALLRLALTHTSARANRLESNQRLEFLGDRVLGLAVADMIYRAFPTASEGELSRRLAELVRRETCAEVASTWGVSDHVVLGEGEAQSGGARKAAILADLCEAIIGAAFLDGGFESAAAVVRAAFETRMTQTTRAPRDPKSALQEWAQARGLPTPAYRLRLRSGPDHAPSFSIGVHVDGFVEAVGEGGSKRIAEQAAAEAFFAREHPGAPS